MSHVAAYSGRQDPINCPANQTKPVTKSDPWHNTYPCPNCEADVSVALPVAKYATCDECKTKLEVHPDADFEDGHWHDKTHLSVVEQRPKVSTDDLYREHMKRMLAKGLDWINDNASGTNCEHKYTEQETAPLGVKCLKCGHFVGAHE